LQILLALREALELKETQAEILHSERLPHGLEELLLFKTPRQED
jgi:hypothetical protein